MGGRKQGLIDMLDPASWLVSMEYSDILSTRRSVKAWNDDGRIAMRRETERDGSCRVISCCEVGNLLSIPMSVPPPTTARSPVSTQQSTWIMTSARRESEK
nr:hypothetical protein CFP56_57601 [Quercus suber]